MSQSVSNAAWYSPCSHIVVDFIFISNFDSMPFTMIAGIYGINWRRLGELPQECGALIMGFLDGKDLWAFVSSSKRWRKISDEVPSLGSSHAHVGLMAHLSVCLLEQLSVWEKKYEKRFGKNAAVPRHLQDTTSWIERYLKYPLHPPGQANNAHDQVSLADRTASFCSFSTGGCATRRTGRPSTSHRAAYSTGAPTGTVSRPTLAPALHFLTHRRVAVVPPGGRR